MAIVAVVGILAFTLGNVVNPPTKTTVDLYNNEQNSIVSIVKLYKTNPMADNETIKWLESLDSSYVIMATLGGVNGYVVMKRDDANKIPTDNDTSTMTKVVIEGYVKEVHNLDGISDVTLLEDVTFVKRQPI
ncbi:MAG: hypothetical protein ACRC1M_08405 [Methanobacteriaceae archaeon]